MEIPFVHLAMDLIGAVPPQCTGNRFVLVVIGYGPRYPEALPLRNISAKNVMALYQIISQVRILNENEMNVTDPERCVKVCSDKCLPSSD